MFSLAVEKQNYSLLNHCPSQLESFKLDQNIPLLADPEFYVFSIGGLQIRERQFYQDHAKTLSLWIAERVHSNSLSINCKIQVEIDKLLG